MACLTVLVELDNKYMSIVFDEFNGSPQDMYDILYDLSTFSENTLECIVEYLHNDELSYDMDELDDLADLDLSDGLVQDILANASNYHSGQYTIGDFTHCLNHYDKGDIDCFIDFNHKEIDVSSAYKEYSRIGSLMNHVYSRKFEEIKNARKYIIFNKNLIPLKFEYFQKLYVDQKNNLNSIVFVEEILGTLYIPKQ